MTASPRRPRAPVPASRSSRAEDAAIAAIVGLVVVGLAQTLALGPAIAIGLAAFVTLHMVLHLIHRL